MLPGLASLIPVCTPDEVRRLDTSAPVSVEELVSRSGLAVARAALRLLGGGYGRRVAVVAGGGNNGADGRNAAGRLAERGARVDVIAVAEVPRTLEGYDLVIDAAFGTGYRVGDRPYRAPRCPGALVLAVDLPSGLDALTGQADPEAVKAHHTVALSCLKPGLMLNRGPRLAGRIRLADIGLDAWTVARAAEVRDDDVARWVSPLKRDGHKWNRSVLVIAGSPGMWGAAEMCARAAQAASAGLVRVGTPGARPERLVPEALSFALPEGSWADRALAEIDRFKAVVIGPGLGRSEGTAAAVRRFVASCPKPLVVDADGLAALGHDAAKVLAARRAPTLLTPHDGEAERLGGDPTAADRFSEVRRFADAISAVVLWKGPTTVVAGGEMTLVTRANDGRLATAGTGDVLAGMAAALMARGLSPERAGAAASRISIGAARLHSAPGLVASDVISQVGPYLEKIGAAG